MRYETDQRLVAVCEMCGKTSYYHRSPAATDQIAKDGWRAVAWPNPIWSGPRDVDVCSRQCLETAAARMVDWHYPAEPTPYERPAE